MMRCGNSLSMYACSKTSLLYATEEIDLATDSAPTEHGATCKTHQPHMAVVTVAQTAMRATGMTGAIS
jgi:hypothetical protein